MIINRRISKKIYLWTSLVFLTLVGGGCAHEEIAPPPKELTATEKARLQVEIANGALVEGDPTGALQNLALAELEDPNLPEIYHSKAIALYTKKDLPGALEAARHAVQLKPNYSDANNTLGKLLMDADKYDEASKYLMTAATDRLYRETYKAWTNLGLLKFKKGDYLRSEAFLNRAIQESPNKSCIAYHFRGHIRLRQRRFSEAISDYDLATRHLCADYGEARLSLGIAYEQSKQYDKARKTFLDIQKQHPNTKLADRAVDHLKYLP